MPTWRPTSSPATQCQDISDTVAQLALQGPKAPAILKKLLPEDQIPKGYYTALPKVNAGGDGVHDLPHRVHRGAAAMRSTPPTRMPPSCGRSCWRPGKELGLIPCGLGARDTLRLEAAMPLYGHEMDDDRHPPGGRPGLCGEAG